MQLSERRILELEEANQTLTEKLLEVEASEAGQAALQAQQESLEAQMETLSARYEERLCAADSRRLELENLCLQKDAQARQLRVLAQQLQQRVSWLQTENEKLRIQLTTEKPAVGTSTPAVWSEIMNNGAQTETVISHHSVVAVTSLELEGSDPPRLRWYPLPPFTFIPRKPPLRWARLAAVCQVLPPASPPAIPRLPRLTSLAASLPPSETSLSPSKRRRPETPICRRIRPRPLTTSLIDSSILQENRPRPSSRVSGLTLLKQRLESQEAKLIGVRGGRQINASEITRRFNSPPPVYPSYKSLAR
eukprot:Protomagalhaensia_wolfi_Nauph_80__6181@NODE_913_length_1892_cov_14_446843_g687_i0_p1_GENE_NODE_913_length_1892_cov_14_446843_g687_i0NODE_913_length_1892_cov_14_446843_g687_i0_p1_ORF_typecomplete_len306_score53_00ERM/PF00769_19/0_00086SMC_N/PF02463_19/0_0019HAUS5/PF14817_6/0_0024HOOK/PF05622_12/0_011Wtap/PF17098_5/0_11DUF1759/PF03564_15/0_12Golgin_A5/PF09787_9/0_21MAD/PF05557_13/1DUF4407/PF14362_6/0_93BicD/PF09730_9/1_8FlxA/PF14282_6/0_29FlxA/PF14282_6/1_4e02KASH_CCD/PF14662_6/0_65KASH_CCD/PF1466